VRAACSRPSISRALCSISCSASTRTEPRSRDTRHTDVAGATGQQAFSLKGTTYANINNLLPANSNSQATGVNNSGEVVGFYQILGPQISRRSSMSPARSLRSRCRAQCPRRRLGSMISVRSSVTLSMVWTSCTAFWRAAAFSRRSILLVRPQRPSTGSVTRGPSWASMSTQLAIRSARSARRCPSLPPCCSSALDCSELVYCAAGAVKHFGTRFDSPACGSRMPVLNTKWEQVDDL
jgi:hypothetical protein